MLLEKEGTNFFELEFAILFYSPLLIKVNFTSNGKKTGTHLRV